MLCSSLNFQVLKFAAVLINTLYLTNGTCVHAAQNIKLLCREQERLGKVS